MSSQTSSRGVDSSVLVEVWRKTVSFPFSTLLIGKPFRESTTSLLIGTTEGQVRIMEGKQQRNEDANKGSVGFNLFQIAASFMLSVLIILAF